MPISHKQTLERRSAASLRQHFILAAVISFLVVWLATSYEEFRTVRVFILAATGPQGRGVLERLYKADETMGVRFVFSTLTRNASAAAAIDLQTRFGVRVQEGDLGSADDLQRAMHGSHWLFGVTFTDFEDPENEYRNGVALMSAIKSSGRSIRRIVFSGGEGVPTVPFLNLKYRIESYFREQLCTAKAGAPRCVFLHTAYFYENMVSKKGTKRISSREETIRFSTPLRPEERIPMIFSPDIGKIAADALLHINQLQGAALSVPIAGDYISPSEYVRIFSHVANVTAVFEQQTISDFAAQPLPGKGAQLIAQMYEWYLNGSQFRDVRITRRLSPDVLSVRQWMQQQGARFILELLGKTTNSSYTYH